MYSGTCAKLINCPALEQRIVAEFYTVLLDFLRQRGGMVNLQSKVSCFGIPYYKQTLFWFAQHNWTNSSSSSCYAELHKRKCVQLHVLTWSNRDTVGGRTNVRGAGGCIAGRVTLSVTPGSPTLGAAICAISCIWLCIASSRLAFGRIQHNEHDTQNCQNKGEGQ